eukprot:gb/GFBE01028832.1/.p1 GENE.gb/GFBE01028832.1/~~gb/GFBE01028832.1/.p1  ORF type:complete len:274 (+),score=66.35 gb/GFBE01028832.1/:1-822(+)
MPLGLSRSSPCLTAAYNLRQYSLDKKRILPEKTNSEPDFSHLDRIDLIGGNGRWRQRRAEDEFARRQIVEEERLREQQEMEERRRQRKLALQAKRRRQQEEEERRRQEERERQRQEQLRIEEERRQAEERERLRREQEERDWLARQPKLCLVCNGSGKCPTCLGSGQNFTVFLATGVGKRNTRGDYGRHAQGCDACYGFKQNMLADLKKGTGKCAHCDGWGKIAPDIDFTSPTGRTRKGSSSGPGIGFFGGGGGGSQAGGDSPKTPKVADFEG